MREERILLLIGSILLGAGVALILRYDENLMRIFNSVNLKMLGASLALFGCIAMLFYTLLYYQNKEKLARHRT